MDMKTTRRLLIGGLLLAAFILNGCSSDSSSDETTPQQSNANRNRTTEYSEAARMEMPRLKDSGTILLVHKTSDRVDPDGVNFSVEWDYEKKSQRWTAYQMTRRAAESHTSRYYGDPQYPMDPDLPRSYYLDNDYYWGSGFDHGHICPSADRLYSAEANYQTFFLTNMQPQYKNFNGSGNSGGVWLTMENKVRQWTPKNTSDTLYIVKGGTIDRVYLEGGAEDGVLQRIDGKLIVPKYFFVALLYKNSTGYRGLALWFPHNNEVHGYDALTDYALSIDELEARTGIDFFCNLPDDIEGQVERALPLSAWGL